MHADSMTARRGRGRPPGSPNRAPQSLHPLARRLRALRRQHGLTQKALAGLLHVETATVCRWECGRRVPSRAIVALAEQLLAT
jgi:DNA-binding transcriptional regulator YiaG